MVHSITHRNLCRFYILHILYWSLKHSVKRTWLCLFHRWECLKWTCHGHSIGANLEWVWPSMNRYIMFFVQTFTRPPNMHLKLTKHGRFCKQNNQLPTKSHDELEDNSILSQIVPRELKPVSRFTLVLWHNHIITNQVLDNVLCIFQKGPYETQNLWTQHLHNTISTSGCWIAHVTKNEFMTIT